MKKFVSILAIILITITVVPVNVIAGEMIDYSVDQDICRFSDYLNTENTLPYVRISGGRIEVDTPVNKAGVAISAKAINVSEDLSRFQVFISQDRIDINNDIENAILISPIVTIDGKVDETVIVFSGSLTLKENSNVVGEILAVSENINCNGIISGNVIATSDITEVTDNAIITGGLRITTSELDLSSDSMITGKIYCKSVNDIEIPGNQKDYVQLVKISKDVDSKKVTIPFFSIVITALIFGLIYSLVNSKTSIFTKINENLSKRVGFTLISGLIAVVAIIPVAIICLMLTIFGLSCVAIPVLIITAAIMLLAISVRIFNVGVAICENMLKTKYGKVFDSGLKKFILGTIVFISLQLIEYIPIIGTYIMYLYIVISAGIFIAISIKNKESK